MARTEEHEVIVAGAGPTGLTLAAELALAGVDVAIVERRPSQALVGQRAGGLHSRSLEVFEQRGIADRFMAAGKAMQVGGFAWIPIDISDFPSRYPHGLALWQNEIERILHDRVVELGVPIHRGMEVTGLRESEDHVEVILADGSPRRGRYVVGCDGGRSAIRKAAGIDLTGWDPSSSHLIAEVQMREEPVWGLQRDELGIHGISRLDVGTGLRVMVTEAAIGTSDPTLEDLSEALTAVYGTDFGVHSPISISRFTDAARQATAYRKGRVLLAGDAAHVHPPTGGMGLNTGVQDAVNLGWKLGRVLRDGAPDSLLDTYHDERHPVAAAVLRNTMAQIALLRTDARTDALRGIMGELLAMDGPRKHLGGMMSGLEIRYDFGGEHPLVGRRMPDLDLQTRQGAVRAYDLLHSARGLLIAFTETDIPGVIRSRWAGRVQFLDGVRTSGPWDLPVIGLVSPPSAVLVRPDGYVAWVGERSWDGAGDAFERWFGRR